MYEQNSATASMKLMPALLRKHCLEFRLALEQGDPASLPILDIVCLWPWIVQNLTKRQPSNAFFVHRWVLEAAGKCICSSVQIAWEFR
mmetsp:Transcript_108796/g.273720  ORF Transcript_108796/g.273720 Transcript_108796/m.273720 type:complete len:88 (+) Transcript_108796:12-275(+)